MQICFRLWATVPFYHPKVETAVMFVMRSGILRRTFPVCMVKKSFTVNQDLKALASVDDISLEYLFWGESKY